MVSGSIPVRLPSSYIARLFRLSSRVLGEGVKADTSLSASITPTRNTAFRHSSYLQAFANNNYNRGIFCIFAAGIVPVVMSYCVADKISAFLKHDSRRELFSTVCVHCERFSLAPLVFSRYFPLNKNNLFWHVMVTLISFKDFLGSYATFSSQAISEVFRSTICERI